MTEGGYRRMPPVDAYVTGVCQSGKRGYWTRAGARSHVKSLKRQGRKGIHAYDCPFCDYFHAGHLSPAVVQGRLTKAEVYPRKENRSS